MAIHRYDSDNALLYGLQESILIEYFRFWVSCNRLKNKNNHEGHTWVFNSVKSIQSMYAYISVKGIRTALNSLVRQGVLLKSNYNKIKQDRTCWYAFVDEEKFLSAPVCTMEQSGTEQPDPGWQQNLFTDQPFAQNGKSDSQNSHQPAPICPKRQMHLPETENPFAQNGEPLPVSKKDIIKKGEEENQKAAAPVFFAKKEEEEKDEGCAAAAPDRSFSEEELKQRRSWLQSRRKRPLSERKRFLVEEVNRYNTQRKQPWPQSFLEDFICFWTQPNFERTMLKYETQTFFGIDWFVKGFWRKATNDERKVYVEGRLF